MRRPVSWVAVLVFVGGAASCSHSRPTTAPPTARVLTPAQTADALALEMLRAVALPADAREYHGALPSILASAGDTPGVSNLVHEYRTFTAREPASVLRFFEFSPTSHGFTGQGGAGSVESPAGKAWTFDSQFAKLPLNIALTQLDVAVTKDVGGGSVIRVDAMASWTPPKPKAEYVPAADHVATVTALHPSSPPGVFRKVVITDARRFAALATKFDRMRLAATSYHQECGSSLVRVPDLGAYSPRTTIHEVAFSTDTHSKPNLIVVLPTCGGVGVRAQGALQPTVQYDESFASAVSDLLTRPA